MSVEENDISWAMKLLEREPEYEMNLLAKNWAYICCTSMGILVPMGMNLWLKRPLWTGIQRHIGCAIGGFGIGHLITKREIYVCARRDAIMRDYIRLHPADFPPPNPKKIADLFEEWVPVR